MTGETPEQSDADLGAAAHLARGRAEIKSRLLGSTSVAAPQDPGYRGKAESELRAHSAVEARDAESRSLAPERSELNGASAAGDSPSKTVGNESSRRTRDEVKWIEPVFVEPVSAEDLEIAEEPRAKAFIAATEPAEMAREAAPDLPANGHHPKEVQAPSVSRRRPGLWWGRHSPSERTGSEKIIKGPQAATDEIATLRQALAAERAAAAARIAELEADLSAARNAALEETALLRRTVAAQREIAADEITALRLTLVTEREAAAEEIAALRSTLTAEREAAADEIATLRTLLTAQREAAGARAARLKQVLGPTIPSSAASR